MIMCDFSEFGDAGKVKELLEGANILATNRIGTGECTSIGTKEEHTSTIAVLKVRVNGEGDAGERGRGRGEFCIDFLQIGILIRRGS